MVSLFEPPTEILRTGEASKPTDQQRILMTFEVPSQRGTNRITSESMGQGGADLGGEAHPVRGHVRPCPPGQRLLRGGKYYESGALSALPRMRRRIRAVQIKAGDR